MFRPLALDSALRISTSRACGAGLIISTPTQETASKRLSATAIPTCAGCHRTLAMKRSGQRTLWIQNIDERISFLFTRHPYRRSIWPAAVAILVMDFPNSRLFPKEFSLPFSCLICARVGGVSIQQPKSSAAN